MILIFHTYDDNMVWVYYNIRGKKFLFTSSINIDNLHGVEILKHVNILNLNNSNTMKVYK